MPSIPSVTHPFVDTKTGKITDPWLQWLYRAIGTPRSDLSEFHVLTSSGADLTVLTLAADTTTLNLGSGSFSDFIVKTTNTDNSSPQIWAFADSASPAANDTVGWHGFMGRDSNGNQTEYGSLQGNLLDPTDGSEDAEIAFNVMVAGISVNTFTVGNGIRVGTATGGLLGSGTINVATSISLNNSAYTNPDYALEHWATGKIEKFKDNDGAAGYPGLTPLDDLEDALRSAYRLPGITDDSGRCIFQRSDIALEKIEEAYIYITQLHARVKELERWKQN